MVNIRKLTVFPHFLYYLYYEYMYLNKGTYLYLLTQLWYRKYKRTIIRIKLRVERRKVSTEQLTQGEN